MIPESYIQRVIQFARQGYTAIDFRTYDTDWECEAYLTVAGPELEQFGAGLRTISSSGSCRTRAGS